MEVPPFNITSRTSIIFLRVASIIAVASIWQASVSLGIVDQLFVASPSQIAATLPTMIGEFLSNLKVTLIEYLEGLALAAISGILVAMVLADRVRIREVADSLIGFGMVTPKVALIPLIILWLGTGEAPTIFFGGLLGVFPILINTMAAFKEVHPEALVLAKAVGHSSLDAYRKVVFPAALPSILTGLFLGSSLTLVGVLIMEMTYSATGVGPLIAQYSALFRTAELYSAVILTILLSLMINGFIWYLSQRLNSWRMR